MEVYLKIAEMAVGEAGDTIKTVLGSCIGLCLHDPRGRRGGMVHIMLPSGGRPDEPPGKYADRAIPALVAMLERRGSRRTDLLAKLAGGASMFGRKSTGKADPLAVGERNREEVLARLKELGIPVVAEDTGGSAGRNIVLDCATGEVKVHRQDGQDIIL